MSRNGICKPPPATYTGTTQEWQALTSKQRLKLRNPGHGAAYAKAYNKTNAVRIAAACKVYNKINTVRITAYAKAYRETNRKDINAKRRVHYEANKEGLKEANAAKNRMYYHANIDIMREKKRAYRLKKVKTAPSLDA